MGDDGAGAAALAWLDAGWVLPPAVERLDLGTPGPYLAELLRGFEAVVLIDTVHAEGRPGEIRTWRLEDLPSLASAGPRLTPHAPDLREALDELALEGMRPRELVLLGILPGAVQLGTQLSPEVAQALPTLVAATVAELEALGHRLTPRKRPLDPDLWWTRPVEPVPALA